jgi:[protein-PII] uridylyltransferase
LGGYARRELCPASDIDLLVLHSGWGRADLEAAVEQLCYPLWDAGLSVGHAVRTPAESVATAGDRIDTATALLDRRLVAGDPGLFDALGSRVQRWAKRQRKQLIGQLARADQARHERAGELPGMLEPDLKNGAGGLRDVHSLRWAAGWATGDATLDALVAAGYVGAQDRRSLAEANETLLGVRCALHLAQPQARGRDIDRLRLEVQDDVAHLLGVHAEGEQGDGDALLRRVGLAARTVDHVHGRAWPLLLDDLGGMRRRRRGGGAVVLPGVRLEGGLIGVADDGGVEDPAWAMRLVAVAAERHAHLTRAAAVRALHEVQRRAPLRWTPQVRSALLTALRAGTGVVDALQQADHVGILAAYLPEWDRVRGLPQRNPLHRYDLDTHHAQAVAALHRLVAADAGLRGLWEGLEDPDSLLLAVWLHDVGKAWPGDHSEVGAEVAGRWLQEMGFDDAVRTRVAQLVRWHLLLPDVATRRDLDDELEIRIVAERVADPQTLDMLYLLSLADGRATGPAAWSAWKDSLMARLHAAVRDCLGAPLPLPDADVAAGTDVLADAQQDLIHAEAPARYLEVADAEQMAAHAELLETPLVGGELRASVRPGTVEGTTVVSVVGRDRRGLVADCAGVLAASDLDVVEARALTGPGGIAFDWFTIQGDVDGPAVVRDLLAVSRGDVAIEQLFVRRRRPAAPSLPSVDIEVTVRDYSTLEISAPDRPGLLYRLCRALAAEGLNVRTARVSSLGNVALDVFEVTPPVPAPRAAAIRSALLSAAATDS